MERLLSERKEKASASNYDRDIDTPSTSPQAADDKLSPDRVPVLISGSLDSTVETWGYKHGKSSGTFLWAH